jgi:predicted SAM-dependent methyltransferase
MLAVKDLARTPIPPRCLPIAQKLSRRLHLLRCVGNGVYCPNCSGLDYTSADVDPPLAIVKMDIASIPYADCPVDVMLCTHVLEHIPVDHKAMSELYRILKPGRWAILMVPLDPNLAETFEDPGITDPQERFRLFNQEDHVWIYGRDFKIRLERVYFTVRVFVCADKLGPALVKCYGLRTDEYVCY